MFRLVAALPPPQAAFPLIRVLDDGEAGAREFERVILRDPFRFPLALQSCLWDELAAFSLVAPSDQDARPRAVRTTTRSLLALSLEIPLATAPAKRQKGTLSRLDQRESPSLFTLAHLSLCLLQLQPLGHLSPSIVLIHAGLSSKHRKN